MSKRFRVAFSFTGSRRAFVEEIATIVATHVDRERVLYDKFLEAELARADTAKCLPALYNEESELVVVVLSSDYDASDWCGLEWNAVLGLVKKRATANVMLMRFDLVDARDFFGLAGYVDLDDKTPAQAAALVLQRLAIVEGGTPSLSLAVQRPDWPEVAPDLAWPVADHRAARAAFAQLIVRTAPFRILPIFGESDTGKSHLTQQFLANAWKIEGLRCARFDFKGSTDIASEVQAFAQRLEVDAPRATGSVHDKLLAVLKSLRGFEGPTLLIFDTFELAGEAERWVRESLLPEAARKKWLRVVVVGQRAPKQGGEPWSAASCAPIELRAPTADEWFEFWVEHGQAKKRTVTREFVHKAHDLVGGKSSILASLFRP